MNTTMFDRFFGAVLVLPHWVVLFPIILHEDSIEKQIQYMRAVHSDHMACPANHALMTIASMLVSPDLSKTSMFVTLSCHLIHMTDLRSHVKVFQLCAVFLVQSPCLTAIQKTSEYYCSIHLALG